MTRAIRHLPRHNAPKQSLVVKDEFFRTRIFFSLQYHSCFEMHAERRSAFMARQPALLGRAERSTPNARRVAPEARGVDGESACRATMGIAIAPLRWLVPPVKVASGSRDDLRRACQVVARFGATTLYSVDPHGIRTMMHSCASTARLLGGGPILTSGIEAMEFSGLPPPRTISA
jgi:hypothetical protein